VVFNKERQLFAMNKAGNCFPIKLLIKQMPSLAEGIQYVGMIKPIVTDYEYFITDINGHIDSMSKGIRDAFEPFKDFGQLKIQILAPELIDVFDKFKLGEGRAVIQQDVGHQYYLPHSKFSQQGGERVTFYLLNNLNALLKSEKPRTKSNSRKALVDQGDNSKNVNRSSNFLIFLKYLKKGFYKGKKKYDLKGLAFIPEYKNCQDKRCLNVEVKFWTIPVGKQADENALRLVLFLVNKTQLLKKEHMPEEEGKVADQD